MELSTQLFLAELSGGHAGDLLLQQTELTVTEVRCQKGHNRVEETWGSGLVGLRYLWDIGKVESCQTHGILYPLEIIQDDIIDSLVILRLDIDDL